MPSQDRRAAARRRAWGRGPVILKFEPLEGRQLLTAPKGLPDLVASSFTTVHAADWGQTIDATGTILNQGSRAADNGFNVGIYASTKPGINRNSVKVGEVSIPGGLQPEQSKSFEQQITLPSSPIPGFGSTTGAVYLSIWVDPQRVVRESNRHNNWDLGAPYDTSPIGITPQQPSLLAGSSLSVTPGKVEWGNTVQLYAQIHNNAQGDAPATTARVVLTPAGSQFGSGSDVTVGTFTVPPIAAWKTVNLVESIKLPDLAPTGLGSATNFTLTVIPDSTFVTNVIYPGYAPLGNGQDQTPIEIDANPDITSTRGPLPDLAATTVNMPTTPLAWGQSFQVSTNIQNIGQGDAGKFNVAYVLVGASGSLTNGLVLADVPVDGLKAGATQSLSQTLKLPVRVPSGLTLDGVGVGRIAVVIDPENAVDEVTKNDNQSVSGPVTLRLLGTDGTSTVPTGPPVLLTQSAVPTPKPAPAPTAALRTFARPPGAKIHRRPTNHSINFGKIGHNLTIFPSRVTDMFKNIFK